MKEADFRKLVEGEFKDAKKIDAKALEKGVAAIKEAVVKSGTDENGLYVKGWIDGDNGAVVVRLRVPARRIRMVHSVAAEVELPKRDAPANKASKKAPETKPGGASKDAPGSSSGDDASETSASA